MPGSIPRLLEIPLFRFEPKHNQPPVGVIVLDRNAKGDERPGKQIDAAPHGA